MDLPTQPAPPQLSPDGQWWWDGQQWVPAAHVGAVQMALPPYAHALPTASPSAAEQLAHAGTSPWPDDVWAAPACRTEVARADRLALASLVLGLVVIAALLLSLSGSALSVLWLLGAVGVAAVGLGHASRRRSERERRQASGVSLAGLIVGYSGLALTSVATVIALLVPALWHQQANRLHAPVAAADGVPAEVQARLGRSPFTPEQFGKTQEDLEEHRRDCSPTVGADPLPAALTYAAIRYDTHFDETLLSWSLHSQDHPATREERAEMVRIDQVQVEAMEGSPELRPLASELIAAIERYDAVLVASPDDASWAANVERAHEYSGARGRAAATLRLMLGIGGGACVTYWP